MNVRTANITILRVAWERIFSHSVALSVALAAITLLSRIPFLQAGYGLDPDAWRVANTARKIAATGEYSASRLPGAPLQEITYSFVWGGGPLVLNGLTALFSALAAMFFALSARELGCKDYLLASLALAFTPVIYLNSTTSMDYVWALAFILGSLYFVLVQHPVVAGVFLGAAIGCRITSGAMVLPLALLLVHGDGKIYHNQNILKFSLATCLAGICCLMPAMLEYGSGFLTFYETSYPRLGDLVTLATVDVWGSTGRLGILIALVALAFQTTRFQKHSSLSRPVPRLHIVAWIAVIILYLAAFLRLPSEPGYLIPIIPFVILLFSRFLGRTFFIFVCITLIFSSFITIHRSGRSKGPILVDHAQRIAMEQSIRRIIGSGNSLRGKSVIVAGPLLPQIEAHLPLETQAAVKYVYLLDTMQIQQYLSQGFQIYYLDGLREYNLKVHGVDLLEYGASRLALESNTDDPSGDFH